MTKVRLRKIEQDVEAPVSFMTPSNVRMRLVEVSPTVAKTILLKNGRNRALRQARIDRYASDMLAGGWRVNGETISISDKGNLLNGQHRLNAVVKANVIVPMWIAEGVDESAFSTIDDGFSRTAGDVLGMAKITNANSVAAVMRITMNYRDGIGISKPRPNRAIEEAITKHNPEKFVAKHHAFLQLGRSVAMSALFIAYEFGSPEISEKVDDFAKGLITGENLGHGDARAIFRNKLVRMNMDKKKRPEQVVIWNYTVRALTHFVNNKEISVLTAGKGEPTFVEIPFVTHADVRAKW